MFPSAHKSGVHQFGVRPSEGSKELERQSVFTAMTRSWCSAVLCGAELARHSPRMDELAAANIRPKGSSSKKSNLCNP